MRLPCLLSLSFAILVSGCFARHSPDGGGGPSDCGGGPACSAGEVCCAACTDDAAFCQSADLPCPDLPCPATCDSAADCDAEHYCRRAEGRCAAAGTCQPRPPGCRADGRPVCSCSGESFESACAAAMAGESVGYRGECRSIPTCPDGTPCERGVCCPLCFGLFECAPSDESCGDILCPAECSESADCAPTDFCRFEAGECGPGRMPGFCEPRPEECTADCGGVCGCDGAYYCNECTAQRAGTNVDPIGMCARP